MDCIKNGATRCYHCLKDRNSLFVPLATWLLLSTLNPLTSYADDFSLRFPSALSRFSSYADVAAVGGASVASQWSSSINPASLSWTTPPDNKSSAASPQYSAVLFDAGTTIQIGILSLSEITDNIGTFQVSFAHVESNDATTRQGLGFDYRLDLAQVQWSKKISDDTAIGANFTFSSSTTEFDVGFAQASKTVGENYAVRLGLLHQVRENTLFGISVDYAIGPSRTTTFDVFGMGFGSIRSRDTTQQVIVRLGTSIEYGDESAVYLDYQASVFYNDTGTLDTHRLLFGVDHQAMKGLYLRSGLAVDANGALSPTVGIGIYPSGSWTIDIAVQHNMFPELAREFGRATTFTISMSIIW